MVLYCWCCTFHLTPFCYLLRIKKWDVGRFIKNADQKISCYYVKGVLFNLSYSVTSVGSMINNYTFFVQNRWVPSKRESTWASPHDSCTPSSPRQRTPSEATPSAPSRSATFFVLSKASPSIPREKKGREYTLQTRSNLCIPRNETARSRSQCPHSCICERFVYVFRNLERGRAVSFLEIFVSNFRNTVFAVQVAISRKSCWWGGRRGAA